jgi:hypothetical protein
VQAEISAATENDTNKVLIDFLVSSGGYENDRIN